MEQLLFFLNAIATSEGWPLSSECLSYLRKIIKARSIKEGDYLLRAGEICTNLYFIQKGLLKCYYILHENEVSDWFFGEGETVGGAAYCTRSDFGYAREKLPAGKKGGTGIGRFGDETDH